MDAMMRRTSILLAVFLASLISARAGTKEEIIRLQTDVLQLQEQMRMMQKSMEEGNGVLKSLLEQLNDQIARSNVAMESVSQGLAAQKTDLGTSVRQLREEMQALSVKLDDTNNRIAGLYQKVEDNQVKASSLRAVPSAEAGRLEPDQVYSQAYNDYLMGNYDLAIVGFQDFLTNYPNSEYADNAMHYLGVCYFEQGRFEQAVQTFDQVINLYPQGDKTPVAYFKKGSALQELQRNDEAIETWKKLIGLFPDSQEAKLAQAELEKLGVTPPTPGEKPAAAPRKPTRSIRRN
jgi:tol-pal system protein YbgF